MGQKVNPHGLRVGVIKTGIPDGTLEQISQTFWLKITTSENI
jgi:hypothetical protein